VRDWDHLWTWSHARALGLLAGPSHKVLGISCTGQRSCCQTRALRTGKGVRRGRRRYGRPSRERIMRRMTANADAQCKIEAIKPDQQDLTQSKMNMDRSRRTRASRRWPNAIGWLKRLKSFANSNRSLSAAKRRIGNLS